MCPLLASNLWEENKSGKLVCSGSLITYFVNNDYVTTEIILQHSACASWSTHDSYLWQLRSWATLCCMDIWAPPRKQWHYCCIKSMATVPAREMLCWGRLCYGSSYGCCISQERINVSAVTMAPQLFFQTLNLCLAYPGFSWQCERQDNWHHEQGQPYKTQLQIPRAQIINIQKLSFENSYLTLLTVC